MVNYACAFSQSESGKYFERIIKTINNSVQAMLPGLFICIDLATGHNFLVIRKRCTAAT